MAGAPGEAADQIARTGAEHVWLVGGADLASQFLRAGRLDSMVVTIVPIVLGEGIGLFSSVRDAERLTLVNSAERAHGMLEVTYTPMKAGQGKP